MDTCFCICGTFTGFEKVSFVGIVRVGGFLELGAEGNDLSLESGRSGRSGRGAQMLLDSGGTECRDVGGKTAEGLTCFVYGFLGVTGHDGE